MQAFPGSDVLVQLLVPVVPGPSLVLTSLAYSSVVVTQSPALAVATARVAISARRIILGQGLGSWQFLVCCNVNEICAG